MDRIDNGWTMAVSIAALRLVTLALNHVLGLQPSAEDLASDSNGGYWSNDNRISRLNRG